MDNLSGGSRNKGRRSNRMGVSNLNRQWTGSPGVNPDTVRDTSRYQDANTPGGVGQDEAGSGSSRYLENVVPFTPPEAGPASPQNREYPSGDVNTSVDTGRSSQTVSPADFVREIELFDGGVAVLVVRSGQCYVISYELDLDVPPTIPEAASHLMLLSQQVAGAPEQVTLAGAIDQIVLAGYGTPVATCSLDEIFEPEDDERTEPESNGEKKDWFKEALPYAALLGALYVMQEQFG